MRITHPDRVMYPATGLTKLDVAQYYEAISARMLPHVIGRPLTLVHCPTGLAGQCRYLRHGKAWGPSALRRVRIRERTKIGEYLVVESVQGLIALAQMDVLEIHTWNSDIAHVERPNRLVFDLDPGPAVAWRHIVEAARLLRKALAALGLASWVKTTGGAGLHVVVPLIPERDWTECLAFARAVAQKIERHDPARYTTMFRKEGRERKILIDYLRNNRTNTSIAAFSTRARADASISLPVRWTELRAHARPIGAGLIAALQRLVRRQGDPWHDYWTARQRLSTNAIRSLVDDT